MRYHVRLDPEDDRETMPGVTEHRETIRSPSMSRRVGLAVLVAHLVLSPLVFSAQTVEVFEYNKVLLLQVAAIIVTALGAGRLLWKAVARPDGEAVSWLGAMQRSVGRDPVAWGVIAFALSAAISTALSMNRPTSFFGAHESFMGLLTILAYTALFFATRAIVGGSRDARALIWATATAAAGSATYAVIQLVQVDPISWGRTASYGDFTRIFATMGHPNFLSAFLVTAFPAIAYLAVRAWRRGRKAVTAALAAVIVVGWAVTVASVSRGAWGALFLAFVALAFGWWRVRERTGTRALGAVAGIGLVAGLVGFLVFVPDGRALLQNVQNRIGSITKLGKESRTHIWKAAWHMYEDHPVAGVGLDTFQLAFEQYRQPEYWHVEWNGTPTKAHNEVLHIAATQGTLGLLALGLLTGGLALALRRAVRRSTRPEEKALLVAIGAGLVGFYAQNLFSFTVAGCGTLAVTYAALLSRFARYDEPARANGDADDRDAKAAAAPESGSQERQPLLSPTALAIVLAVAGIAAVIILGESIPPQEGNVAWERKRAVALALYLASLVGVSWAMTRAAGAGSELDLAASRPADAAGREPVWVRPDRVLPARLALFAPWPLAAAALWWGIAVPFQANAACRDGRTLVGAGRPAQAVASLEEAVALDPTKELYWVQLGTAYYTAAFYESDPQRKRTMLERARDAHARSVALVPVNAYDHANLARALSELARLNPPGATRAEVFRAFDDGLAIDPNNAYFLGDAGKAALALGAPERARDYAMRNRERYPYYGPSRAQLGVLAMRAKRWDVAEEEFAAAVRGRWFGDEAAVATAAINLATTRITRKDFEGAVAASKIATERYPGNPTAWLKRARAHELLMQELDGAEAAAQRSAAVEAFERALGLSPGNAVAKRGLERLRAR
jgi:O-antigen ligase